MLNKLQSFLKIILPCDSCSVIKQILIEDKGHFQMIKETNNLRTSMLVY